jgi:putative Mn2+ efflux pump MntP
MTMDFISILVIAAALAMDAFSVSVSAGMAIMRPGPRHYFRLAFHFGLFQFMMPIIGYFGGNYLENYIRHYDHWIAFGLLTLLGIKMMKEAFTAEKEEMETRDPSRGMSLVLLSIATSIDALAVGLSFGVLNQPVLIPSIIIGLTCAVFSVVGITIGKKAASLVGKKAEAVGGIMLIIIGVKILVEHVGG